MDNTGLKDTLTAIGIILAVVLLTLIINVGGNVTEKQREKIGFVMLGKTTDAGWNASQYDAIKNVCDKFGTTLLVKENIGEGTGECTKAVRELAEDGAGLIFLSSYSYSDEAKDFVSEYPNIAFGTNSAEHHAKNMTGYFVRMYQARYLSGIIAGMRTKTNVIGYVAAMPNSEVNRGINAFALGAQKANPQAQVVVTFTGSWQNKHKETKNAEYLITYEHADVLTYHQDERTVADVAERMGVDFIAYHEPLTGYSPHNLTSVVCRWNIYYTDIVRRYLKGEINSVNNHWLGLDSNVVYLSPYSSFVTSDISSAVNNARKEISDGRDVFSGVIYDNEGNLRCAADETISDETLLKHIDWLAKGVRVVVPKNI